jgi:hypothetical protein
VSTHVSIGVARLYLGGRRRTMPVRQCLDMGLGAAPLLACGVLGLLLLRPSPLASKVAGSLSQERFRLCGLALVWLLAPLSARSAGRAAQLAVHLLLLRSGQLLVQHNSRRQDSPGGFACSKPQLVSAVHSSQATRQQERPPRRLPLPLPCLSGRHRCAEQGQGAPPHWATGSSSAWA